MDELKYLVLAKKGNRTPVVVRSSSFEIDAETMHLRPPPPSPPPPHYEMFQNAQSTYTFAVTGVMLMVAVLVLVFCVAVKVCSLSGAAA